MVGHRVHAGIILKRGDLLHFNFRVERIEIEDLVMEAGHKSTEKLNEPPGGVIRDTYVWSIAERESTSLSKDRSMSLRSV